MATVNPKACLKVLPAVFFVLWSVNFIFLGAYTMLLDSSFRSSACGMETHLWKFCLFNTVFCFFTCASYFLFPGGGEGARARAMVITIFHLAFAVWGILMWLTVGEACWKLLNSHYQMMVLFHHITVAHNVFFFVLMFSHEAYIGKAVGADLTLMSEIHQQSAQYAYAGAGSQAPLPHQDAPMHPQGGGGSAPPPDMAPLNNDIAKDYENIIKTPPGHLPQGQP